MLEAKKKNNNNEERNETLFLYMAMAQDTSLHRALTNFYELLNVSALKPSCLMKTKKFSLVIMEKIGERRHSGIFLNHLLTSE